MHREPRICEPADPTRARLGVKAAARPRITYKWKGFAPVDKGDFGDPTDENGYTLCMYDPDGIATQAAAPPAGTCGAKPCWKETKVGWKYGTSTGTPQGVAKIRLKAGIVGKPAVLVKAHGDSLVVPFDRPRARAEVLDDPRYYPLRERLLDFLAAQESTVGAGH